MNWKILKKEIVMRGEKLNLVENIDKQAGENPDKLALSFEDEAEKVKTFTYSELTKEINKFANYLDKITCQNSRVFIFLPKCPEMYISILGTIKQGSIACPLFEAFQTDGLELRLERGEAQVLITNRELLGRLKNKKLVETIIIIDDEKTKKEIERQDKEFKAVLKDKKDTSLMMFTSSTAGTPVAGIMLPHYGIIQQVYTGKLVLELNENSRYWCTAHPGWVTGAVYGVLVPFSLGSSLYVLGGRFQAEKWIEFLKKNKINIIYTAPTVLRLLKEKVRKADLQSVRNLCSVGEALHKETFEFYKKLGVEIRDTYWQTETGSIVIANYEKIKKGSMGKAVGVNAKILNGEIVIEKGFPSMMTGIYKHEKMYKEYFSGKYFLCKDLAKLKDGFFYFEGRKDDIIKTRGERVSPIEIESSLMKHKDVKEVAVIGVPDAELGAILKAFIVLREGIRESEELKQEISLFVKSNYAGHAYPKIIEFVSSLPKTNSGKIIRSKLRENENQKA